MKITKIKVTEEFDKNSFSEGGIYYISIKDDIGPGSVTGLFVCLSKSSCENAVTLCLIKCYSATNWYLNEPFILNNTNYTWVKYIRQLAIDGTHKINEQNELILDTKITVCDNDNKSENLPLKSHWVKENFCGLVTHKCFRCNKDALHKPNIYCALKEVLTPFCPFCGAQMEDFTIDKKEE